MAFVQGLPECLIFLKFGSESENDLRPIRRANEWEYKLGIYHFGYFWQSGLQSIPDFS